MNNKIDKAAELWGAHAPRVLVSAPPPKRSFGYVSDSPRKKERVCDGEGAIASTRGRVRSPEDCGDPQSIFHDE
jgi:hypothetical protein